MRRGLGLRRAAHVEDDAADLGLVLERGGGRLDDHRKAERRGRRAPRRAPTRPPQRGTGTPKAASAALASCSAQLPGSTRLVRCGMRSSTCASAAQVSPTGARQVERLEGLALALQRDDAGGLAQLAGGGGHRFRKRGDRARARVAAPGSAAANSSTTLT